MRLWLPRLNLGCYVSVLHDYILRDSEICDMNSYFDIVFHGLSDMILPFDLR